MSERTRQELSMLQALPLSVKIEKTKRRIQEFIDVCGIDGVYISFSGGKDSTVLLDICRSMYPNMRAMFVDVPTQYPELKQFTMTFENVDIVKPKMSFFEVCEKYGFPLISKEVADKVDDAKKYLKRLDEYNNEKTQSLASNQAIKQSSKQASKQAIPCAYAMADFIGVDRRINKNNKQYQDLKMGIFPRVDKNIDGWWRYSLLTGQEVDENGQESIFNCKRYAFLLNSEFGVSKKCCDVMKKNPAHKYGRDTGRKPIIATMASESRLRASQWIQHGCNSFDGKNQSSKPMSFWTEQDVLLYIYEKNLPICSVYGDVVTDYCKMGQCDNQVSFMDYGFFDNERPLLKTTGCSRTGCMLCGFGCHLEKSPNRFEMLKETHPKMYALLDKCKNNGVTMREAIDWINENGNMNIKY